MEVDGGGVCVCVMCGGGGVCNGGRSQLLPYSPSNALGARTKVGNGHAVMLLVLRRPRRRLLCHPGVTSKTCGYPRVITRTYGHPS